MCTEICSAAMFSNDDPDIVISNTLFADGSAAVILNSKGEIDSLNLFPKIKGFDSLIIPEWRDLLRFRTEAGYLRNVLGEEVPKQAGQAMKKLIHNLLSERGLNNSDIAHWIFHTGGEKVLDSIKQVFSLEEKYLYIVARLTSM